MAPTRSAFRALRKLPLFLFPVVLWLSIGPAHARDAAIVDLQVELVGEAYSASFRVDGAFTEEMEERIASGLETSFRHRIRIYRRRTGWLDKVEREKIVTTTVQYDTLTRQYTLSRRLNGQLRETEYTEDPAQMRRWMSELQGIPLGAVEELSEPGRIYVKVKSNVRDRFFLFFIPVRWNTEWESLVIPGPEGPDE
jgi:hypothetical protein